MLKCHLVRWRSHNCLPTPPQYVRTISHTALFKDRGGDADRRGGRGDKKKEREIQISSNNVPLHCVWVINHCKTWLITARSILLFLPLSFSLHFTRASSFLPSTVSICSSTASPLPPCLLLEAGRQAQLARRNMISTAESWEPQSAGEVTHAQATFPTCTVLRKRWGSWFVCVVPSCVHLRFSFHRQADQRV